MNIKSFIRSVLQSTRTKLASSRAWIGSAAWASRYPSTPLPESRDEELDVAWEVALSMLPLPASFVSPRRRCTAFHEHRTPYGTTRTLSCTSREGHAGPHVVARRDARPTERFLEHGVVHDVTWFNYTDNKVREIWTRCGLYFATANRTRNNRLVTCMRCVCR